MIFHTFQFSSIFDQVTWFATFCEPRTPRNNVLKITPAQVLAEKNWNHEIVESQILQKCVVTHWSMDKDSRV